MSWRRRAGTLFETDKQPVRAARGKAGNGEAHPLKLFGGCHGVSDFRTAAIDASELMLRATAALDRARSDPSGAWLRDYEEKTSRC